MKIELITRPQCSWCQLAKETLIENQYTFTIKEIGKDITREEVLNTFPDSKILPLILIDDKLIGGYRELLDRLGL